MRACVLGFRSLHLRKLQDGAGAVAAYPTGEHNFELNYENRTTDQWLNNSAQYTPKSYKSQDMIVSWPQTVTRGWMSAMISFFWRALGNGKKIFPRFGENNLGRYRPQSATRIGVNGWPVTLVGWTVLVRRGPPGRSGAQLQFRIPHFLLWVRLMTWPMHVEHALSQQRWARSATQLRDTCDWVKRTNLCHWIKLGIRMPYLS